MMKGKNRKKKHVKWLLAMIAIVIALTCIFLFQPFNSPSSHIEGTQEEKEFDALQIKGKWSQIIEKYQERPTSSLACRKVMRLAQIQKGLVGKEAIYECLSDSREVLTSPTAALMMSDVYMQLGMVNMAQRAAFREPSLPQRERDGFLGHALPAGQMARRGFGERAQRRLLYPQHAHGGDLYLPAGRALRGDARRDEAPVLERPADRGLLHPLPRRESGLL